MEIPSIKIYSQHSVGCPNKGSDYALNCDCKKWLRWSHAGKQFRKSAGTRSLKDSERVRRQEEDKYVALASGKSAPAQLDQKTIAQAAEHFIQVLEQGGSVRDTNVISSYIRDLKRFEDFMVKAGKFYPAQVTSDDIVAYKTTWGTYVNISGKSVKTTAVTKKVRQMRLKKFFGHCKRFQLVDSVPHMDKIHIPENEKGQTIPLVKEGYHEAFERLLAAVSQVFEGEKATRTRGLLLTMRHSGLAIHDATTLRRDELRLPNGKPYYRVERKRTKTGVPVSNVIPPAIAEEILATPNNHPDYLFWNTGTGKAKSAVTNWKKDLKKVFIAAGLPKGHPHQLRDLFAVSLLEKGISMQDVSRALGHKSIITTERHYAPWVPALQARLDEVLAGAF